MEGCIENATEQILKDAVDNFGVPSQLDMAIEECAELIQAINKIKRTFSVSELLEIKNGKEFKSVKGALAYGNMCSEIADVKIMMKQLEYIFSADHISVSEERKLTRLQGRIEKFKAGDANIHK
jgi:NTP pyrophosphatase (non-canonical NTP hydrolase)